MRVLDGDGPYKDRFPKEWIVPDVQPQPWQQPAQVHGTTFTLAQPLTDEVRKMLEEMRALIAEFREALHAAQVVDRLTKQPDCEDPEKAKLVDRVAELERRLNELEPVEQKGQGRIGRIKSPTRTRAR